MKDLIGKGKPFYSALDQAAEGLKRNAGTGQEFMQELAAQPGVKQQEIQDRMLAELHGLGKMNKQQFLGHLKRKPAPAIKEKTFGQLNDKELFEEFQRKALIDYRRPYGELDHEQQRDVERYADRDTSHHGEWVLPGGENYREMLIKVPDPVDRQQKIMELEAKLRRVPTDGATPEQLARMAQIQEKLNSLKGEQAETQQRFEGDPRHYAGEPGILASMRVTDRTGPNGEKLLHLEELQSDWHQQGREKGYKGSPTQAAIEAGMKQAQSMGYSQEQLDSMTPQQFARLTGLGSNAVPDAPFKKNWEEMALKRLVHHAAEKGYHGIVVTPGAEQADRWSLAKHIDRVELEPNTLPNKGTHPYYFLAYDKNGKRVADDTADEKKLQQYLGKDVASKLLSAEPSGQRGARVLDNANLVTGGEGMKAFYDKKVPNILNAIGKKHGVKTKLHSHEHGVADPNSPTKARHVVVRDADNNYRLQDTHSDRFAEPGIYASQQEAENAIAATINKKIPLHHFPITENMRKEILTHGLPLYEQGGVVHKAEGGNVQPTPAQMKLALMKNNPLNLQSIGANEAPNMMPKAYLPPDTQTSAFVPPGGAKTPAPMGAGGIDMSQQPGQQLMSQGMMPQQQAPQGAPAPQGGLGQPPGQQTQQPGMNGNILEMTPAGRALNALNPNQPPGMADGGEVDGLKDGSQPKITKRMQTVKDPLRMAYPGIYQRPDVIAAMAASRVAPEDPALKRLFGVTREDLYQMSKGRQGNLPGALPGMAAQPRGSEAAARVMNPRNTQRLIDVMAEAEKHPELVRGMDPWYVMDPLFQRLVQLIGLERAKIEYPKMNTLMGMASPGSEVNTEIPRGTAAYYLQKHGRFEDFLKHAGTPEHKRGKDFPADIRNVPGHAYHKTAQATPMAQYLESGQMEMKSPKVPMYIEASGVPQTGFQTATPVGDAHWSRAVGLADVRGKKTIKGKEVVPGASVSNPEMAMLAPWWRENVASKLGLESVPAQARAWGAFSPQTGVTTPIGAPKLELIAKQIMQTAKRMGVSPETARDYVLTGETYAGKKKGGKVNKDAMRLELTKSKKAK